MSGGLIFDMGNVPVIDAPYRHLELLGANLEYWNIFEGDGGNLTRNLVEGKAAGQVVGTPVWDPTGQVLNCNSNQNFIQTGVEHTENMSFYAIGISTGTDTFSMSNYGGPRKDTPTVTTTGVSLMPSRTPTSGSFIVTQEPTGGGASTLLQANTAQSNLQINAVFGRHSSPGVGINGMSGYNMTTGSNTGFAYAAGNKPILGSPFRVGSSYSFNGNVCKVMMAIAWSRVLGLPELGAIHAYFKEEYAAKGFNIGG